MSKVHVGYDGYGLRDVDEEFIHFIFDVVIGMTKLSPDLEAGLILATDKQMQELNRKYRGKDVPANILSFAYRESDVLFKKMKDDKYLGDIYISHPQLIAQAKSNGTSEKDEFARLFVHGLLHLAGIHHGNKAESDKMEALEDKIVAEVCSIWQFGTMGSVELE